MATWGFYGRTAELQRIREMIERKRWFFAKVTGRRRIGKTELVKMAVPKLGQPNHPVFYVQIPDSRPAGVLSKVDEALETFGVPTARFPRPRTLLDLANLFEQLAMAGYVVILDEFQYFNRKEYVEFFSYLQDAVDRLAHRSAPTNGGWIVLGSIHAEMTALLEDRSAPLYNRVTDRFELGHLDIASLIELLDEHSDFDPERLLFLWSLFEGVPKYYRDCFEQGMLRSTRKEVLQRMFFESSSPLRSEAENGFLLELRGQYDVVLKYVARNPGRAHKELVGAIQSSDKQAEAQIGSYLKTLTERYRLIERRLPIFAKQKAKKGRYYLTDNF